MYSVPSLYSTVNYKVPVTQEEITICKSECMGRSLIPCDETIYDLCILFMNELNMTIAREPYDGINVYVALRVAIRALMP